MVMDKVSVISFGQDVCESGSKLLEAYGTKEARSLTASNFWRNKGAVKKNCTNSHKKITTLPCLTVFVSLLTKNKSKSSSHTEKFAKSRLKEKSSGRMRTKRQNRKECCFLRCFPSSPGHWQTSKLPWEGRVLSDRKIDLQTTLSSRSQLESSAGKLFTSSSANQTPRQELRTTPLQGARMEGSATSEGQNDNFLFCGCWCNFFFTAPLRNTQCNRGVRNPNLVVTRNCPGLSCSDILGQASFSFDRRLVRKHWQPRGVDQRVSFLTATDCRPSENIAHVPFRLPHAVFGV